MTFVSPHSLGCGVCRNACAGPELGVFGVDWVRKWLVLRERLIEIAKVLRRFPWMVGVVKQRPMNILHPYTVEVYMARDGSEACLSLNPPKANCIQKRSREGGQAGSRVQQVYEEKTREVHRPKGLLEFAVAKERETTLTALFL